ncbi:MAG: glycosyltransferase family 39 protein [Ignavibacteriales bacterium]|nr:glycosyltransferase family 39 protein [Ignavibacteriales bacterium]
MRRVQSFIRDKEAYVLALLLLLVASGAGVVLYSIDRHVLLYFGDAASHIVKARQLIDSQHPGLESIGTIWLPLPHFLLVPFVFIDSLFYSGIAGPALGIPFLVATGVLLFSIVRRITGSSLIAFVSACLFGLNPNVIYMALTPMNELSLFFFVTVGGYAFLRWREEENDRWLLLCAAAVMLASLCRYEAWILAAFVSLVAAGKGISDWKRKGKRGAVRMLAIAVLSLTGILIWLCWNKFEFGNAFEFAPWKYRPGPADVHNPMSYRQEPTSITLMKAVLNIFGPVALLACVAGIARLKRVATDRRHLQLLAFFSLPALFMFAGILKDSVLIDQWWWNWRFVLVFGLFLSVATGMGLSEYFSGARSRLARGVVVAALFVMPIVQLTVPSVSVATYEDATQIFHGPSKDAAAFGEKLGVIHKRGSVLLLTGTGLGGRIMLSSWLPLKDFHIVRYPGGQDILGSIRSGDRYVVIGKVPSPESREVVHYWLSRRGTFLRHYEILLEDDQYILLERRTSD